MTGIAIVEIVYLCNYIAVSSEDMGVVVMVIIFKDGIGTTTGMY